MDLKFRRDAMRMLAMALVGLSALLVPSAAVVAQNPGAAVGLPTVPTTKVLAIGHMTAAATPEALNPVMKSEVPETVKLYLAGKIDSWYVRQDQRGVVFLMNVSTVEEAHALLEKLPLGQAKLMEFDYIPLGPLSPLGRLLVQQAAGK